MDQNHLQTIAEIGVAIVGFSGIVALFSSNLKLKLGINRLRFVDLLLSGFGSVFLAFVPSVFAYLQLSEPRIWWASEIAMALWFTMTLVLLFRLRRKSQPESKWFVIFPIIGVGLTLTLMLSILGLIALPGGFISFVGLLWLLGIASIQFSTLILKAVYDA